MKEGTDAKERALRLFTERFGESPDAVVRAPGRVNIIGEHTDYNEGFVLPAAVDRDLCIALQAHARPVVEATSEHYEDPSSFEIPPTGQPVSGWPVYIQGVAWALCQSGYELTGWRGALASDIPVGAGLSSSAAIELAAARAFQLVSGFPWEPMTMALTCQRAENGWVGLESGIMDQVACAAGQADHALLLDCRSLDLTLISVPQGMALVVLDTGTRRELAGSAYGDRRRECEAAASALGVSSLRDVPVAELDSQIRGLSEVLQRRARHVVSENARTLETAESLRAGDPVIAGQLMDASHDSLRYDFEVSSTALDAIVAAARRTSGCYGARLTGGGFAGCAVALVEQNRVDTFMNSVSDDYRVATGKEPTVYVCAASDGASFADIHAAPG